MALEKPGGYGKGGLSLSIFHTFPPKSIILTPWLFDLEKEVFHKPFNIK